MPILAVDGNDGSGKTTAAKLMSDYLGIDKGIKDVRLLNMPGGTELGQDLRAIIKSKKYNPAPIVERLIFAADTMQFEFEFTDFVKDGGWVICDRFSRITDLIYGTVGGIDLHYLTELQDSVGERLKADVYFVFQLPVDECIRRKEARETGTTIREGCRIEAKGRDFMSKISAVYNGLTPTSNGISGFLQEAIEKRTKKIIQIDATPDSVGIFKQLQPHLDAMVEANRF